jgi:hypothetical protein
MKELLVNNELKFKQKVTTAHLEALTRYFFVGTPENISQDSQPLTEMSTRNLPQGKGQLACKADNLTAICELMSHNPVGLQGLLTGIAFLYQHCS